MTVQAPILAVSSWSVHRALGISWPSAPGDDRPSTATPTWGPGSLSLMELPAALRNLGIDRIEICSFHVPAHDVGFLAALRAALADADVTLQTLLIDDGDITDPVHRQRDIAWIGRWIDVAAALGAERARVIGGKREPSPEVLDAAVAGLAELARRGNEQGVRILTENWFDTLGDPAAVNAVLDRLEGSVGFLADFGNWKGPSKYADLGSVLGRAEDVHAKCTFSDGLNMDAHDFGRCLDAAVAAGYGGPYTLIYESPDDDEWQALRMERDFVLAHAAQSAVRDHRFSRA
jgi:sugar phosphate isomerase/epimerase